MLFYNTEPSAAVLAPDNYSYLERKWRAPAVEKDEVIMFDEPGRVLGLNGGSPVCCRSHYFRVTKPKFSQYRLRVKHGGGEESWDLDYNPLTIEALGMLDSDSRYRLLHVIMRAHQTSAIKASDETAQRYASAFLAGKLKKRKKKGIIRVEIIS